MSVITGHISFFLKSISDYFHCTMYKETCFALW